MYNFIEAMNTESDEDIFRFCLDIGHAVLLKQDIRRMIKVMAEYLVITHLHDNNGIKDLHSLPYTNIQNWGGSFSVDWVNFIQGMKEINYRGTLSFETAGIMLSMPEELKAAADAAKAIDAARAEAAAAAEAAAPAEEEAAEEEAPAEV